MLPEAGNAKRTHEFEAVRHVSSEDLERYLLGQLTEERTSLVARHVSGCETCSKQLEETTFAALPTERRTHPRVPTDHPARLRVLQPVVLPQEKIRILDTSPQGLKLVTKRPTDLGAVAHSGRGSPLPTAR